MTASEEEGFMIAVFSKRRIFEWLSLGGGS